MGHGRCGGVATFLDGTLPRGEFIGRWISLLPAAARLVGQGAGDAAERHQAMELASVRQSIDNLTTFPFVRGRLAAGAIALHGAWLDIGTGALLILDPGSGMFEAIAPI